MTRNNALDTPRIKMQIAVAVAFVAAFCANAAYLELNANGATDAFYNPAQWVDGASGAALGTISSEYDYRAGGWYGMNLYFPPGQGATSEANPFTFGGKSLVIGCRANTSGYIKSGYLVMHIRESGTQYLSFPNDGLVLSWGYIDTFEANQDARFLGKFTFSGSRQNNYEPRYGTDLAFRENASKMRFLGSVHSAASAYLNVLSLTSQRAANNLLEFAGDMSDCKGTIRHRAKTVDMKLSFTEAMPGTITVETNATISSAGSAKLARLDIASSCTATVSVASGTLPIGTVAVADGGELLLSMNVDPQTGAMGGVVQIDSLDLAGDAKVHVAVSHYFILTNDAPWTTRGEEFRIPVMRAPAGTVTADDFVFDGFGWTTTYYLDTPAKPDEGGEFYRALHTGHVLVEQDAGGETETVYLVQEPIAYQIKADPEADTANNAGSSAEDGTAWSGGLYPRAGVHYLVAYRARYRMPNYESFSGVFATPWNVDDYVFPGRSLTTTSKFLAQSAKSVTVGLLRNGGYMLVSRNNMTLKGRYESMASAYNNRIGTNYIQIGRSAHINMESEIFGPGHIEIYAAAEGGWGWEIDGEIELTGTNTAFVGTMCVRNKTRQSYPNGNVRVILHDERNLGGSLGSFNWHALELRNRSQIIPRRSMRLADPTRGVYVNGEAEFTASNGVTLTVEQPITYKGTLTKSGAGTLALGSAPRFGEGLEDAVPGEGENVLVVTQGWVKALSPQAFKNLKVAFADGTGIAYDATPPGAMSTSGIDISSTELSAASKIRIGLDPATFAGEETTIPIFSGTRAQVEAAVAKCRFVKPADGWKMAELTYEGDADNTVAKARFAIVGFVFVVK